MIRAVVATEVGKRYGHQRALHQVTTRFEAGALCALLGANGAGKSTLLAILSTLARPSTGQVAYHGEAGLLDDEVALRGQIGVLAHATMCYAELSARENLRFFAALHTAGPVDVDQLLDRVGLEPTARDRPARTYSRGMWQRLALARALLARPSCVLLDEPFTGLDRGGALALGQRLAELKAEGAVVVVVTHDLEAIADVTDHVVVLQRGRVRCDQRDPSGYDYARLRALYHEHAE